MLNSWSTKLGYMLVVYGGWGLLGISFLDSSLIPFPVLNDLALIVMASRRPAWWPMYAMASTIGSVLGIGLLYLIARGGGNYFWRKTKPQALTQAQRWLNRHEFVTILVACLLPPPAPLKAFILAAGILRANTVQFMLALMVGRGLRFGADAWLGARYGVRAQDYVRHNLAWTSVALVTVIVGLALLHRWWTRMGERDYGLGSRD